MNSDEKIGNDEKLAAAIDDSLASGWMGLCRRVSAIWNWILGLPMNGFRKTLGWW